MPQQQLTEVKENTIMNILLVCTFATFICGCFLGFLCWFDRLLNAEDNGNKTIKQEKLMS